MTSLSLPAPTVEPLGERLIVRDDLLPGGTKVRYILPLLASWPEQVVVYASPAYGYAQIALAHCCARLGKEAVIFVAKRQALHPRTLEAYRAGATVYQVPNGYLSHVQSKARRFAEDTGARLVPFGVDVPEALVEFAAVARSLDVSPTQVWTVSGSGALTRGLQAAWPSAEFHTVRVGADFDPGAATVWTAPERFEQPARHPPPFPSCDNYDAKAWQFFEPNAAPGALFWNVGA